MLNAAAGLFLLHVAVLHVGFPLLKSNLTSGQVVLVLLLLSFESCEFGHGAKPADTGVKHVAQHEHFVHVVRVLKLLGAVGDNVKQISDGYAGAASYDAVKERHLPAFAPLSVAHNKSNIRWVGVLKLPMGTPFTSFSNTTPPQVAELSPNAPSKYWVSVGGSPASLTGRAPPLPGVVVPGVVA